MVGWATQIRRSKLEPSEKQCPFCAETIKAEAIRCKHCQADLSAGPSTPAAKPGSLGKILLWIVLAPIIAFGVLMIFGAMSDRSSRQAGGSSSTTPSTPRADQQVRLDSSAIGCMTLTDLDRALDHYARAEYTAWAEITGSRYCFHQSDVSTSISWTVMQVRGDHMQIGLKLASEYSKNPDLGKFNYWTLTKWALFTGAPGVPGDPAASPPKSVTLKVGSKSKPATFAAPIRTSADPSAAIKRGVKIGAVVQIYQLDAGMARISKDGQPPEWIVPEMLDW